MTIDYSELVVETGKVAPGGTVVGLTFVGVPIADWLVLATLLFTLLQVYFLLRDKWWRQRKDRHGRKR